MATIDEIFDTMAAAEDAIHEYLVIDPNTREIIVPETEEVFGVVADGIAERKFFQCPRYVGDGLDLAGMFLTVYFRNANGEADGWPVDDVVAYGDNVYFSWLLSSKVTAYQGTVSFGICADLPDTAEKKRPDWNTTMATGTVLEGPHPEAELPVEESTSDVVARLREMVQAQTAAVEAEGAAQLEAIETTGTEQVEAVTSTAAQEKAAAIAAIQAQGEATRASIPTDYTALADTVDRLTRDRAAAIVCEAEGAAIQVNDASNDPLQGLRIFGKSTQDGTPTPDNPVEIVSLPAPVVGVYGKNLLCADLLVNEQFVKNADGTYTLTKNGTGVLRFSNRAACNLSKGTYTLSVRSVTGTDETVRIALTYDTGAERSLTVTQTAPKTFNADSEIVKIAAYLPTDKADGEYTTMGGLMLELGDVATEYEPYTGHVLTLTTPEGLPGIPVSSGGNYTDETGQQWIADEVDLARGVHVQRVKFGVVNIRSVGTLDNGLPVGIYRIDDKIYALSIGAVCNKAEFVGMSGDVTGAGQFYENANSFGFSGAPGDTLETLKSKYDGAAIAYVLAAPIETPLTDAELQAFRALHSNKPTTTLLNSAGAHMIAEYAADPKLYIDRRIAELIEN